MTRTLTITYDKSNEDTPVLCVAESDIFSMVVRKIFTGEKAEQLYNELTGQNVIAKLESEDKELTNEEAIKILKSKLDGHTDTSWEWTEAVRLAINALDKTRWIPVNEGYQKNMCLL